MELKSKFNIFLLGSLCQKTKTNKQKNLLWVKDPTDYICQATFVQILVNMYFK